MHLFVERIKPLLNRGYVSLLKAHQEENEFLSSELQSLKRQPLGILAKKQDIKASLQQFPLDFLKQSHQIHRKIAQLQQQLANNKSSTWNLQAPLAGSISALLVKSGQSVTQNETLLTLLPSGAQLIAQLLLPSKAIGFIKPGNRVILRYQAYPYQKFGQYYGYVDTISHNALTPKERSGLTGSLSKQPMSRVFVTLNQQYIKVYGQRQKLKAGMAINADFLLNHRNLIEWVFEPLLSMEKAISITGGVHE